MTITSWRHSNHKEDPSDKETHRNNARFRYSLEPDTYGNDRADAKSIVVIKIRSGSYRQLGKAVYSLGQKEARSAVSRALKRAATSITIQGVRTIKERRLVKMPSGDLKKMFNTRMRVKGDIRSMYAVIKISNQAISLAKFWPKKVNPPSGMQRISKVGYGAKLKAVKVTVMGRTQYAGAGNAFLVDNSKGGVIMMRTGPKRTPIKKLYGPSVSDMVIFTGLQKELQDMGMKRFEETLAQELAYRTSKLKSIKG